MVSAESVVTVRAPMRLGTAARGASMCATHESGMEGQRRIPC
jgi:hypothetical protein